MFKSRQVGEEGDGFDYFSTPDLFNQNDDNQADVGEPNSTDRENPNGDANAVSDETRTMTTHSFRVHPRCRQGRWL